MTHDNTGYLHPTKGYRQRRIQTDTDPRYVRDQFLAHRYNISRSTVWRWVKLGLLPKPKKIAGSSRFDLEACDHALQSDSQNEAA